MKFIIIFTIAFVLLIPTTAFAQNNLETNYNLVEKTKINFYDGLKNELPFTVKLDMYFASDYVFSERNPIKFKIKATETNSNEIVGLFVMFHREGETPDSKITSDFRRGLSHYMNNGDAFALTKISSNPNTFSINDEFNPLETGNIVINPIIEFQTGEIFAFSSQHVVFEVESEMVKQQAISSIEIMKQTSLIEDSNLEIDELSSEIDELNSVIDELNSEVDYGIPIAVGLFISGICFGLIIDWKKLKASNKRLDEIDNSLKMIGSKVGVVVDVKKLPLDKLGNSIQNHFRAIVEKVEIGESVNAVKNAPQIKMTKEEIQDLAKELKKQDDEEVDQNRDMEGKTE